MLNQPTIEKLQALRLLVMAEAWNVQGKNPKISTLSFDERFGMLVDAEYMARDNRRLDRLLKDAQLRYPTACIEDVEPASSFPAKKRIIPQEAGSRRNFTAEKLLTRRVIVASTESAQVNFGTAGRSCAVPLMLVIGGVATSRRCAAQASRAIRWRATTSRLRASTDAETCALNDPRPLNLHRVRSKLRLRKEMIPSMPARKFRKHR